MGAEAFAGTRKGTQMSTSAVSVRHRLRVAHRAAAYGLAAMMMASGLTLAVAQSAPPAPSADAQRFAALEHRVLSLEKEAVSGTEVIAWAGGFLALLSGLAGFIGYPVVKRWVAAKAESMLTSMVKAEVESRLPTVLQSAQQRAEEQILRLAKLLAMRANKAFDEALREVGWTGNVADLRNESPIFRRALIDCLYNATQNRKKTRDEALQAVGELLHEDTSPETVRLALRIYVSGRRFREGQEVLERHKKIIRVRQGLRDVRCDVATAGTTARRGARPRRTVPALRRHPDARDDRGLDERARPF